MVFRCLGSETTSNGPLQREIVYQAHRIPGCLDHKMWDSGFLHQEPKNGNLQMRQ
jgi:hypothetical protein